MTIKSLVNWNKIADINVIKTFYVHFFLYKDINDTHMCVPCQKYNEIMVIRAQSAFQNRFSIGSQSVLNENRFSVISDTRLT